MKKKIKLRKKYIFNKKNKKSFFYLILIIVIGVSYFIVKLVGDMAVPSLMRYAEREAYKITNIIVNKTVENSLDDYDLYIINKDNNDNINMLDFNTIEVNKLLTRIITNIQKNFQHISSGNFNSSDIYDFDLEDYDKKNLEKGIIYRIPIGVISNTTLLSNLGPTIPVKITLNGDIKGNVSTKVTNYGINNALIETTVNLEINQLIMLPITSKNVKINLSIPIAMKLIQGLVPNFYYNGIDKNSNTVTLPIE